MARTYRRQTRPILATNGIFRGWAVPAGTSRVEMRHFPASLRAGLGLLAWGILVCAAIAWGRPRPAHLCPPPRRRYVRGTGGPRDRPAPTQRRAGVFTIAVLALVGAFALRVGTWARLISASTRWPRSSSQAGPCRSHPLRGWSRARASALLLPFTFAVDGVRRHKRVRRALPVGSLRAPVVRAGFGSGPQAARAARGMVGLLLLCVAPRASGPGAMDGCTRS